MPKILILLDIVILTILMLTETNMFFSIYSLLFIANITYFLYYAYNQIRPNA